jgi:hypothetical protein
LTKGVWDRNPTFFSLADCSGGARGDACHGGRHEDTCYQVSHRTIWMYWLVGIQADHFLKENNVKRTCGALALRDSLALALAAALRPRGHNTQQMRCALRCGQRRQRQAQQGRSSTYDEQPGAAGGASGRAETACCMMHDAVLNYNYLCIQQSWSILVVVRNCGLGLWAQRVSRSSPRRRRGGCLLRRPLTHAGSLPPLKRVAARRRRRRKMDHAG